MRKLKELILAVGISLLACWAIDSLQNYEPPQSELLRITLNVGSLPPMVFSEIH
mgnify:FL=1